MVSSRKDDILIAPLVLSRYRQMGVIPGWNTAKLLELAKLANRTPEELGAFATLYPSDTRRCMLNDHFSPAVSLHLMIIKQAVLEVKYGEPTLPLMPLDLIDRK